MPLPSTVDDTDETDKNFTVLVSAFIRAIRGLYLRASLKIPQPFFSDGLDLHGTGFV
jgi:hypothetical protein